MKIAHLTSVHGRRDTRIFLKECRSLARHGYDVSLVVADGNGDETVENIKVVDVGRSSSRLNRMFSTTRRVLARAVSLNADIYHFHDPELLFVGLILKIRGKYVIYDAHEDLKKDILSKYYLPKWGRSVVAAISGIVELTIARRLSGVVAATPSIREKFARSTVVCININNYPILGELSESAVMERKPEVCFVGGMTDIRGVYELTEACRFLKTGARLNLVGEFAEDDLEVRVRASEGWSRVNFLGFLSREGVREVMGHSVAGIVTFLPEPSHLEAQPNKMFEYMSAGLPVIASDFPLWREIIAGHDCGVLVDPSEPAAIAAAIDHFVSNPRDVARKGQNGKNAVRTRFNWGAEETKLLAFYRGFEAKHRQVDWLGGCHQFRQLTRRFSSYKPKMPAAGEVI